MVGLMYSSRLQNLKETCRSCFALFSKEASNLAWQATTGSCTTGMSLVMALDPHSLHSMSDPVKNHVLDSGRRKHVVVFFL
jgi:hypothetical protein